MVDGVGARITGYLGGFLKVTELEKAQNDLLKKTLYKLGADVGDKLYTVMQKAKDDGDVESAYNAASGLRPLLIGRLEVANFLLYKEDAIHERVVK
ncbi:MAG: hypothetical protein VW268_11900 [Rhodospirillaceae bacterium]